MPILYISIDTCQKLIEGYLSVFVNVEDRDDPLNEGVLIKFRNVEDLFRVQITRIILIDLFESCI
jgi:hypothetical protein